MHRSITLISIHYLGHAPFLDKIQKTSNTKNLIFLHVFQTQLTPGDFLIVKKNHIEGGYSRLKSRLARDGLEWSW